MRELPTGTVTFLFTDIEGSTKLLDALGDDYADALAEHRSLLRDAFDSHGGVEVDTQGDAFFYAFASARSAVAAAARGQEALEVGPVRVRMGVHTGEPTLTREGYVGMDVHRGARIAAAGHGGQVLVSQATRELVDADLELVDLGEHRLKDMSAPLRLWQLGEGEFPPLKTLHQTNLPVQATALIGREPELAEAGELLRDSRLLTLTGPGGSGKTRLALQVAAEAVDAFPDGVWWVSLAALTDPELVLPTVAQTLGARGALTGHLRARRTLILLDNLEQVIECAPQLAELLATTSDLKLLVTSREALRIEGEREYAVEPLAEAEAVALFVERAVDAEPREIVAEICRRLDCLPLAVELAAARTGLLPPEQLLERLDRRLSLLTSGRRDAPARQRTLRATIEWSHDLLSEDEKRLFRRLGVFAGSFTLEGAEAVADADLDSLQSLVDKSLVRRWGSSRLGMLETVRALAVELLDAAGEGDELRLRQLEYLVQVGEAAGTAADEEGAMRFELIAVEWENARAALAWALESGEVELGGRLAIALEGVWIGIDPFEGAGWSKRFLERSGEMTLLQRARLLRVQGGMLYITGRFEEGRAFHEQSLELFRELGDERGIAHMLGRAAVEAHRVEDFALARALAEESLTICVRRGNRRGEAEALTSVGNVAFDTGDHARGIELLEESAAMADELGLFWWQSGVLLDLAEYSLELDRPLDSEGWATKVLELARRLSNRMHAVWALALLARTEAESGDVERAGRLWGAIEAEEARGEIGQWEAQRDDYAAPVFAAARAEPGFERGREQGRALTLDQAVAYALGRS